MEDEYVVEEISEDDYDSSSSEDEVQNFLRKECGLQKIEDDFETEVDKVMSAHLKKLNSSKETNDDSKILSEPSTSELRPTNQDKINDDLLYDPDMDEDDERWVNARRRSYIFPSEERENKNVKSKPLPNSDAVLNCPACLSLLCLDCQRHDIYKGQYRAMFVSNCKIISEEVLKYPNKKKKSKKHLESVISKDEDIYNAVRCTVCNTEVAVYDKEEIYHFFNVLASY